MLYKQMQVKEIPIVFRGKIEGATAVEADIEASVTTDLPTAMGFFAGTIANTTLQIEPAITVLFDNVKYENVSKKDYSGFEYYGATFDGSNVDFTEYPFMISNTGSDITVYCPVEDTHTLSVWYGSSEPIPTKKIFEAELTGNGQIKRFHARFACGENGTLHLNPYVILNGNITVNLCDFAKGGENYISGDNEDFTFECYVPIETHAILYVEAENVGEYDSMLDVAIVVQYEDFIEEETIIGYEGINLRRIHR